MRALSIILALLLCSCAVQRPVSELDADLLVANAYIDQGQRNKVCLPGASHNEKHDRRVQATCFDWNDESYRQQRTFAVAETTAGDPKFVGFLTPENQRQLGHIGAAQTCAAGLTAIGLGMGAVELNPIALPVIMVGKVVVYQVQKHKLMEMNRRGESTDGYLKWPERIAVADCLWDAAALGAM